MERTSRVVNIADLHVRVGEEPTAAAVRNASDLLATEGQMAPVLIRPDRSISPYIPFDIPLFAAFVADGRKDIVTFGEAAWIHERVRGGGLTDLSAEELAMITDDNMLRVNETKTEWVARTQSEHQSAIDAIATTRKQRKP